jgi:hypothetical protein
MGKSTKANVAQRVKEVLERCGGGGPTRRKYFGMLRKRAGPAVEANVFQKLLLKDFVRVGQERMLRLPLYGTNNK